MGFELLGISIIPWIIMAVATIGLGISKTSIGGAASISIALFAMVLPAKNALGFSLLLLMSGDAFAIWLYRKKANWHSLERLAPMVLIGAFAGIYVISRVSDAVLKPIIGWTMLFLVLLHFAINLYEVKKNKSSVLDDGFNPEAKTIQSFELQKDMEKASVKKHTPKQHKNPIIRYISFTFFGTLTGFCSMTANAGGIPLSVYMLSLKFSKLEFMGTMSYFFCLFNWFELPFALRLGMLNLNGVKIAIILLPAMAIGALLGKFIIKKVNQDVFAKLVVAGTIVASLMLLIPRS